MADQQQERKTETKQLQGWKRKRGEALQRIEALKRSGTCYVCQDLKTGEVFGKQPVIYEDDLFRIVLDPYPRVEGQAILVFKPHRDDLAAVTDGEARVISQMCVRLVRAIKEALGAEKVYMLTMCDGPISHLNFQFFPRFPGNMIGLRRLGMDRRPIENAAETAEKVGDALLGQSDYRPLSADA